MSMESRVHVGLIAAALLFGGAAPAAASLMLTFANDNPDCTDSNVFVTFGGGGAFSANIIGAGQLEKGTSYSLAQLASGVDVNQFISGRIYLSLGQKLTSATKANGFAPNFLNPTVPNYFTRWDKVEITYDDKAGGANLTAQDFFSVPLKITASGGDVPTKTLKWNANTATVFEKLAELSGFSQRNPPSGFDRFGAIATCPPPPNDAGCQGVRINGVADPVIRIINPSTVDPKPDGGTVYPSFADYIKFIKDNAIVTTIAGANPTGDDQKQTYDFATTVAKTSYVLNGTTINPGDLVFNGTVSDRGGKGVATAILVRAANFTDSAIYGAAAMFQVIEGANTNSVAERALGDYLSALNFGLIGSGESNRNDPGKTIGESPSWTWYGNNPDGSASSKLLIEDAFAKAQPGKGFYNQVAAYLVDVTDAYGFAFNDRLQLPLLTLRDGSTLAITVQPDVMAVGGSGGGAVPEPATLPLLAGAIALLLAVRWRRAA